MYRVSTAALVIVFILAVPATADAAPADAFEPAMARELLPAGVPLGTVADVTGSTEAYQGTGQCVDAEHPDGYPVARVFVHPEGASRAFLSVRARHGLGGTLPLCAIAVYRADPGDTSFDPFDVAQRSARRVSSSSCAPGIRCNHDAWLSAGNVHYIVLWSDGTEADGSDRDTAYEIDASVKRSTSMSVSVSGERIKDRCYGYNEVIARRRFTIKANMSPNVNGSVRFSWYALEDGEWELLNTKMVALENGNAYRTIKAGAQGKRKAVIRFIGSKTSLPVTGAGEKVMYITPKWTRYADGGARLYVPFHRQQKRLSCEAATLRMAHNYFHHGRIDYDMSVLKITGIDRRRPAVHGGCDPNRAFCGDVNGSMMTTGYGVHYQPIARAANHYDRCRTALKLYQYSHAELAKHINNGHPVIVWGAHRGSSGIYKYRWRAWTGSIITAYSVEHVWTVIGFHGPPTAPTSFVIHNPSRGSAGGTYRVSAAALSSFTKYYKRAVVVRG